MWFEYLHRPEAKDLYQSRVLELAVLCPLRRPLYLAIGTIGAYFGHAAQFIPSAFGAGANKEDQKDKPGKSVQALEIRSFTDSAIALTQSVSY